MFDEEMDVSPKKSESKNLEPMSVEELRAYIESLKAEIVRVEQDIKKKQAYNEAAASVFKS